MPTTFNFNTIRPLQRVLNQHPVYSAIHSLEDLRCFMNHHIYSVWDFMSIVKYLQQKIAPTHYPWIPQGDGNVRRFINELVLEEESDKARRVNGEERFCSHFELYCQAMQEVGATTEPILAFLQLVQTQGIEIALKADFIPEPSRQFTQTTFALIQSDKPHVVAAALALGREHIIPAMFRTLLAQMGITVAQAPIFHYYLNRHIHLDEDFHAPLSMRLLHELCQQDGQKLAEAEQAAYQAIQARIAFWDGVLTHIRHNT